MDALVSMWDTLCATLGPWGLVSTGVVIAVIILGLADKITGGHIASILCSIFSSKNNVDKY